MKKSFFKINNAAANRSGAMETETIQKNGASSKNYTNKGKNIRKFLSVLTFMIIGCDKKLYNNDCSTMAYQRKTSPKLKQPDASKA